VLTGLSPAVKDFNAMLINGLSELAVEAFPQDCQSASRWIFPP